MPAKPIIFGVNGKNILCWSIFAIEPKTSFRPILGYWTSENASGDYNVMGEFVSLVKRVLLCTTRKRIWWWSLLAIEPTADFCSILSHWPSKNGSCDHDVKGEFVSLGKSMVSGFVGKIISFRLFLSK